MRKLNIRLDLNELELVTEALRLVGMIKQVVTERYDGEHVALANNLKDQILGDMIGRKNEEDE